MAQGFPIGFKSGLLAGQTIMISSLKIESFSDLAGCILCPMCRGVILLKNQVFHCSNGWSSNHGTRNSSSSSQYEFTHIHLYTCRYLIGSNQYIPFDPSPKFYSSTLLTMHPVPWLAIVQNLNSSFQPLCVPYSKGDVSCRTVQRTDLPILGADAASKATYQLNRVLRHLSFRNTEIFYR